MSIFSENKKFLFIHIEKNAGSSLVNAMSKGLKIKWTKNFFYFGPFKGDSGIFLSKYEKYFGKENILNWYKFCISRNPLDRMISWYNYNGFRYGSFHLWMYKFFDQNFDQINYIRYENGEIGIDEVFKLEEISTKWAIIEKKLNFKSSLPHKNSSLKLINRNDINIKQKKNIYERFYKDYKFFEYPKDY